MTAQSLHVVSQETRRDDYTDPVVREFHAQVIEAVENAPDGASLASAITGLFHIHHKAGQLRQESLAADVRRLAADDSAKGAMLAHVSRTVGRAVDDTARHVGRLHHHQAVEGRLHDLAGHLDAEQPETAAAIREHLTGVHEVTPPAAGTVVIAAVPDPRWRCGWFRRPGSDKREAHPFAGWVLVAVSPEATAQHVEAAFSLGGQWFSKSELAERGLLLDRMD